MKTTSANGGKKKNKMPSSVPFIVASVFFERFSTGGILAILALFIHVRLTIYKKNLRTQGLRFQRKLGFDQDTSTALYHTYEVLIYITTIFGAVMAESWLGMFKTVTSMNFLYAIGAVVVTVAGIETLNLPYK